MIGLTAKTAGGNIFVLDTNGDLPAALVNAGAGDVDLAVTNGDLLSAAGDSDVADIVGDELVLRLNTNGHNFGASAANRLEINANRLQLVSVGGALRRRRCTR